MLDTNEISTMNALEAARCSAWIAAISLLLFLCFICFWIHHDWNMAAVALKGWFYPYLMLLPFPVLPTYFITYRLWKKVFKSDASVKNRYTALVGVRIVIISYFIMCLSISVVCACFLAWVCFLDGSIVLGELPSEIGIFFIWGVFLTSFSLIVLVPLGAIFTVMMRRFQVQRLSGSTTVKSTTSGA